MNNKTTDSNGNPTISANDTLAIRQPQDNTHHCLPWISALLATLPDLIWLKNPDGVFLFCNPLFEQFVGADEAQIIGKTDYDFFSAQEADIYRNQDRMAAVSIEAKGSYAWLTFKKSGYRGLFQITKTPVYGHDGEFIGILGVARDITQSRHTETLLKDANTILKNIALGTPLTITLELIVRCIETQNPDMYCTVMLLDASGQHLFHGCNSRLPETYRRAIDGILIGPSVGSCGTAAYTGQAVYADDIATDPLWADYADLALQHGLRACWSTPIFSVQDKVIGTFAVYYLNAQHTATSRDIKIIGHFTYLAGIAIEREQTEVSLKSSVAKFRRLIEHAPLPLVYVQFDNSIKLINQRFTQLFGYNDADIHNFDEWWSAAYPVPEYRNEIITAWNRELQKALAENSNDIPPKEFTITCKNGIQCITEIFGIILEDGFLVTFVDLTRYKNVEQTLKNNEMRMHSILQNTNAGIAVSDSKGTLIELNDSFAALLGYKPSEILGMNFADLTHPDDLAPMLLYCQKINSRQLDDYRMEKRLKTQSGDYLWVDISVNAIRDKCGGLANLIALAVDISERKHAENQANKQLQELHRWHQLMLGRETRVLELKREINNLLAQQNQPPRYKIDPTILGQTDN